MNYQKEFKFFTTILKKMNLDIALVQSPFDSIPAFDHKIRSNIYAAFDYSVYFKNFFDTCQPQIIYKIFDEFLTNYIVFELPYMPAKTFLIIGPYLLNPVSEAAILQKAEDLCIPLEFLPFFKLYFKQLPLITDSGIFFTIINSFGETIWESTDNFSLQNIDTFGAFHDAFSGSLFSPGFSQDFSEIQEIQKRYQTENTLIQAVTQGKTHEIETIIPQFGFHTVEQRLSDPVRNAKNYAIIMNTLLRKAAQNGSVQPYHIHRISSDFARKIELLTSENAATSLLKEMARRYAMLVKNHSLSGFSPLVRKVITHIDADLSSDQSLKAHAKRLNVNPCYLSSVFKKETGVSLTNYVAQKRIKHAIFLLNSTSLQIQTIAEYCGFPDLCYFSNTFKKIVGKSPSAYRNSILH